MILLDRRNFLTMVAAGAASGLLPRAAHAALASDVFTAAPDGGLVDSTVIMGEERAVLIDAQFTVPNATRLADMIAATGRALETIYVTHYHPDHHLGLDVFVQRFPETRVLTHAKIQPLLEKASAKMLEGFQAGAPAGVFAENAVIPEALDGDAIMLEGERIEILDPMHGDTDLISAVHIPALDTLVASDFAYADTFAWTAENTTPDRVDQWLASLAQLETLGASTVVPGHRTETSVNDASVITKTRAYLETWKAALESAESAEELKQTMLDSNAGLGFQMALDRGVAAVYPK